MRKINIIRSLDQIKILADDRRIAILRLLMAQPATISQLGKIMHKHPAWVKHHLDQLLNTGAVQISHIDISSNRLEKYYSASFSAYYIENLILPQELHHRTLYFMGSHDMVIESLVDILKEKPFNLKMWDLYTGSLDGLIFLRKGHTQISGCHLLDEDSGQFNLPFIRHILPDIPVKSITLAHREQGLMISLGNPKGIYGLSDLSRQGVRFINRNPGSGTRIWLDKQLLKLGIDPSQIEGYKNYLNSHLEIAKAISDGIADVGLGLKAAAAKFNLEFIPLFEERYDLVFKDELLNLKAFDQLLDFIQGKKFREMVASLPGYRATHTGNTIY